MILGVRPAAGVMHRLALRSCLVGACEFDAWCTSWHCCHAETCGFGPDLAIMLQRKDGGVLVQWFKLPAWKVGGRGFKPSSGIQVSKKQKDSSPLNRKRFNNVGSYSDREVACSASDRQGSNLHLGHIWQFSRFQISAIIIIIFCKMLEFANFSSSRNFARIKASRILPDLQYIIVGRPVRQR